MDAQVLVDVAAMGKFFATRRTLVRLLAGVQPLVVVQAVATTSPKRWTHWGVIE